MASKKYKSLLLGIFSLLTIGSFAQQGGTYDVFDSSVVSKKDMPQQNEFWNNTYSFPAKPRNQWEIGFSLGMFTASSDVTAKIPTPGGSIHIRKALGYVFSLRAQYTYGIAKGLNWQSSTNYAKNTAWNDYNATIRTASGQLVSRFPARATDRVFYNYRSQVQDLSLDGLVTLNNVRFHKQKTGMVIYGGAGVGVTAYQTKINAYKGTPSLANSYGSGGLNVFNPIATNNALTYKNRKSVLKALKSAMDGSYETLAQNQGPRRAKLGNNTLRPSVSFMAGIAFKLSKRINLALEDKFTVIKDDLLDGQMWAEQAAGDAVLTGDYDTYNYLSLGLNFNLGAKSVEPLWWINPLDYAYSELNNPRHMKLPKPVYEDTDGDGVLDQLDKEPNTPAGCPVDTHGVTKDTDGDGVPDCKDKQLITPTECQPVDADGVGKCPPPACCADLANRPVVPAGCTIGDLPSISFKGNTSAVSSDAKAMLATVASKLKGSAECAITITGYPAASKASQALCNKRVDAIKMYLIETEGISADRITTNCEVGGGDANTVDIKSVNK